MTRTLPLDFDIFPFNSNSKRMAHSYKEKGIRLEVNSWQDQEIQCQLPSQVQSISYS